MKLAPLRISILLTIAIMGYTAFSKVNPECLCYLFQSSGNSHGIFKSPNFPRFYPINLGCILYIFVGALDELVEMTLYEFDMRPLAKDKRCSDYLRLYLDLDRPELNEKDRWNFELCGPMANLRQSKFFSRHRVIIAEFHTSGRFGYNYQFRGFKGNFNFVKRAQFKSDGIRSASDSCRFVFDHKRLNKGRFFSPNYPQNYPNASHCTYDFIAAPNERVIVDFDNIKLEHFQRSPQHKRCDPISAGDKIMVYDGPASSERVLGRFCGLVNTRQVVSHGSQLSVVLKADGNGLQAQGFAGRFQFVNKHTVQPSKILDDTMRGDSQESQRSSCTHEFVSSAENKSGRFTSPTMPYEPNAKCLFTFKGLPGERVSITFRAVQLDEADPKWCRSHSGDKIDVFDGMSTAQLVLAVICGQVERRTVTSSGSYLTVRFEADAVRNPQELGFKATYSFVPERELFKEQATKPKEDNDADSSSPATSSSLGTCRYEVDSRRMAKQGIMQTPGYPNGFQKDIVCYWLFYGQPEERIRIKFLDFSLNKESEYNYPPSSSSSVSSSTSSTSSDFLTPRSCAGRDSIQIFKFYYREVIGQVSRHEAPIEFCGAASPNYVMSGQRSRLDVIFQSGPGSRRDSRGVRFQYQFVKDFAIAATGAIQKPGDCTFHFSGLRTTNGSFNSPNYPGHYPEDLTCNFIFRGHTQQKISITFADFNVASMDSSPSCSLGDYVEASECMSAGYSLVRPNYAGPRRFCRRPRRGQVLRIDWPASCLHLRFKSNSVDSKRGFFAYYSFYYASEQVRSARNSGSARLLPSCLTALLALLLRPPGR